MQMWYVNSSQRTTKTKTMTEVTISEETAKVARDILDEKCEQLDNIIVAPELDSADRSMQGKLDLIQGARDAIEDELEYVKRNR